jgi:hypothetical protein
MNANVQLYWNIAEEGSNYNRNNSTLMFNNGGFWSPIPSNAVAGASSPYSQTAGGVTQAGYFTVSTGTVSTNDILTENPSYRIVPNPSNGNLELIGATKQNINVVVFNSIGQEILNTTGDLTKINQTLKNQMINQPKGVYFLRIKTEETTFTTLKIIIQ